MDLTKQKLLLEYLINSPDTFALCSPIVDSTYFEPELRNTVTFLHDYYEQYSTTPDVVQIEAETSVSLNVREVTRDQIEYCATEIETFCKRKAVEKAVLASPDLISKGDYGKVEELIKEAVTVSLKRDLGLAYFDDPQTRLDKLLQSEVPTPTMWSEFDELLNGGIVRKQMLLFSANSGGGKSIAMANLGLNFMMQGHRVLYITLELSEAMVALRYDSMVTGIHAAEWKQRVSETVTKIESVKDNMGELYIKYMNPGSTSNDFRSYLKEFELQYGNVPDMIIVDYLDIMGTNEKISADNVFEKDKRAAEQLRSIGNDYNAWIITAAQQNRGAVGQTELNHSHIAGGISKVNTTDVYVSLIMNDTMRAQGNIAMQFLKTRSSDGVGKTVQLQWHNTTLRITNPDGGNNPFKPKDTKNTAEMFDEPTGDALIGLMSFHNT